MEEAVVITLFGLVVGIPFFSRTFFDINNTEESTVSKRLPYFDILRGIAILAVILIHVRHFFGLHHTTNDFDFLYGINNISRFAIAFFLICSGVLLNPIVKSWKTFYAKKFFRIGIPYILVTLFLAYGLGALDSFWSFLLNGTASVPYYFLIILFQCYLLYPLLVRFKDYKKELLIGSFLLSFASFLYPDSWRFGEFPLVTKFLFFFVYGFVKRNDFLHFAKNKKDLIAWSFITFVYLILALFDPDIFYNVRLFYGVALFNLFFFIRPTLSNIPYLSKLLTWLGKNSLWIYLIHFPFTKAMYLVLLPEIQNYYVLFFATFIGATLVTIPFAHMFNWTYSKFEKLMYKKSTQ